MTTVIKTPAIISADDKLIPVDLYDELTIQKINERKIQIQKISGYKIPTNDKNPVYQAAAALQKLKPNKFGAVVCIQKNIPTFSGLNSQLSNAAGVLIALNQLWKFNLSQNELVRIAKAIDSKLAEILKIFLNPKIKRVENIVLVRPKHIIIDKNWINAELKPYQKPETILFRHFPDLKIIIRYLQSQGACRAGVSGKGSVIFGFFDEAINKKDLKKILKKKTDFIWMGKTCNMKL